jgi:hypothetical protein
VHQLCEYHTTGVVDGVDDRPPSPDVLGRDQPWLIEIPLAVGVVGVCALGDDERETVALTRVIGATPTRLSSFAAPTAVESNSILSTVL